MMNKQLCYCNKCKGKVVSKRTFRRHLLKEQNNPYIKPKQFKQNTAKQAKNDHFDVYSNSSPEPIPILYNNIALTSHNRMARSVPSIPILQEVGILDDKDDNSIVSKNDIDEIASDDMIINETVLDDMAANEKLYQNYSDNKIISEYEVDKYYINTSTPINIHHNPLILDANKITRWVMLWIYLFQDTFVLPQTASATLLDFFKKLLQSFNDTIFSDFPSTIYRADRLLGVEREYRNYIVCPRCHHLYLPDILNGENQHIICKCNEIITKIVRTSKGNHLIKVKILNLLIIQLVLI